MNSYNVSLLSITLGPSAKGKSQGEWKKLGTLIGSVNVLKRLSESKQKEREALKEAEEAKVSTGPQSEFTCPCNNFIFKVLKKLGKWNVQPMCSSFFQTMPLQDQKPIYRSAMAMDIHFLKENRRHISEY